MTNSASPNPSPSVTPADVANWMLQKLLKGNVLYQDTVVYDIAKHFGSKFTYVNDNGNLAIDKDVLREFRRLTSKTVIWDRGERMWRFRDKSDDPDRRQQGG